MRKRVSLIGAFLAVLTLFLAGFGLPGGAAGLCPVSAEELPALSDGAAALTDLPVVQRWADDQDQAQARPAWILLRLTGTAEGSAVPAVTRTAYAAAEDGALYTFRGLPVFEDGAPIRYTVSAVLPEGWTDRLSGFSWTNEENALYLQTAEEEAGTVILTHTYHAKFVEYPIVQKWRDERNKDGLRPAWTELQLYADGEPFGPVLRLTGDSRATDWRCVLALPAGEDGKPVEYTVSQAGLAGLTSRGTGWFDSRGSRVYTSWYEGKAKYIEEIRADQLILDHQTERTEVVARVVWDDERNLDGVRPETVRLQLYADGVPFYESSGSGTIELDGEVDNYLRVNDRGEKERWTAYFSDLPRYRDKAVGQEIVYTVREFGVVDLADILIRVNDGAFTIYGAEYKVDHGGSREDGFVITNSYKPQKVTLSVLKQWDDDDDQAGARPASLDVALLADGEEVTRLTLNETGGWRGWVWNMPRFRDGKEILYTWEEVKPEGYGLSSVETNGTVTTLTNTYGPGSTDVSVILFWEDDDDRDGVRPDGVLAKLYADGEEKAEVTLDAESGWRYEITGLPRFADGREIEYTWTAEPPQGYEMTARPDRTQTVLVAAHEPEAISLTVVKTWDDNGDQAGTRPEQVEVALLADGEPAGAVTLSELNGWKATLDGLFRNSAGTAIEYTWQESEIPGYSAEVKTDGAVTTITNIAAGTGTESGSVRLEVVKHVSGDEPQTGDGPFAFELYTAEADRAGAKLTSVGSKPIAQAVSKGAAVVFPEIAYSLEEAGQTYWFVVKENTSAASVFYEYDQSRYAAGVTVTLDENDRLRTSVAWYKVDEETLALAPVGQHLPVFENERLTPASLTITKMVVGSKTTRHFDFTVSLKDESGSPLAGSFPYTIQDGDGAVTEEGAFKVEDGTILFRIMDGEMIVVRDIPLNTTFDVREAPTKAFVVSTRDNGETSAVSGTIVDGGAHVDFINTAVTTDFTVRKEWKGVNPGWSISLTLGTIHGSDFYPVYPQPTIIREGDVYYYKDLPKYDDQDNLLVYAVKESPMAGYGMIRYDNPNSNATAYALDKGKITNGKTAEFRVRKLWTGVKEGEELPEINLVLWKVNADGDSYELVTQKKVRLKNDEWYTFTMVEEGASYYVTEDVPDGFSVEYDNGASSAETEHAENYGTIINHKLPRTGDSDPVGLWRAMVLTGLAGLAGLAVFSLRRKQRG